MTTLILLSSQLGSRVSCLVPIPKSSKIYPPPQKKSAHFVFVCLHKTKCTHSKIQAAHFDTLMANFYFFCSGPERITEQKNGTETQNLGIRLIVLLRKSQIKNTTSQISIKGYPRRGYFVFPSTAVPPGCSVSFLSFSVLYMFFSEKSCHATHTAVKSGGGGEVKRIFLPVWGCKNPIRQACSAWRLMVDKHCCAKWS